MDRTAKQAAYEDFGAASCCIFDPDPDRPELTVFELQVGAYRQTAQALAGIRFGSIGRSLSSSFRRN